MAKRVFQHYFARVSDAIQSSTDQLAREFYSHTLISQDVMKHVLTTPGLSSSQKSSSLVCAVGKMIDTASNEKPFKSFCRVMKSCGELESLVTKMTERFGKCCMWEYWFTMWSLFGPFYMQHQCKAHRV